MMKTAAALALTALFAAAPATLRAQVTPAAADRAEDTGPDWFPGGSVVAPLLAAPLEVRLAGALIFTNRDIEDSIDGANLEARVAIGVPIPVVRFQDEAPGRPAIDLGFEVGVFSRFFMESIEKEQIGTDYRVGVPLGIRYGMWDARLTLLHVSSHLGDDYLDDNPQSVYQISREGFELLLGIRPGFDGRLYVGGDLNLGRSEDYTGTGQPGDPLVVFTTVEKWAFRFGAEWDPTQWGGKRIGPFAAADFEITDFTDRVASYVVAGAAFRIKTVRLLLNAEFHDGPSPMGQFRTVDERWIGANLTVEL
ncbi:MAG: DUF1207 domain-containing protein [Candidatus Palauibacterales bacterium]|nr:DUF1207 domain-containing protein [Candidatus Palauibacterales bacterium]